MRNNDNITDNEKIGLLLQKARVRHKVVQRDLCDATGLTINHISAVERGGSKASVKMLMGYWDVLGVTPNDILGYDSLMILSELRELLSNLDKEHQALLIDFIKLMNNYKDL